jgi:hypothetical protein
VGQLNSLNSDANNRRFHTGPVVRMNARARSGFTGSVARMLGTKASWLYLNKISQSFLAKGITILSLTAFAFSHLPWMNTILGSGSRRIEMLFVGSLIFVVGYFVAALKAPPEFNGRSEATQIVAEMLVLDTYFFFSSRRQMLRHAVDSFSTLTPFDMPIGYLQFANHALAESDKATPDNWKNYSRDVYHADIQLRQFQGPRIRLLALVLLGLGTILMLLPTGLNVLSTIRDLIF